MEPSPPPKILGVRDLCPDPVSRREARRILRGLEHEPEIVIDFTGVTWVGQGFVDEVFRVWSRNHPETRLAPVNMAPAVEFMVRRGLPRPPSPRRRRVWRSETQPATLAPRAPVAQLDRAPVS